MTERIVSDAKAAGKKVAVAAPTGVAALNVGGCTLHSVAKIGVQTCVFPLYTYVCILQYSSY